MTTRGSGIRDQGMLMRTITLALALMLGTATYAQEAPKPFEPKSGQAGKDVVWVPSTPGMVNKMLAMAKVTPNDVVMDLGSGDGRNIIAAAKLGARALGVEFNPEMVALSRKLAAEAGVADTAQFVEGDMYAADISKANVLALFLLPVNLNHRQDHRPRDHRDDHDAVGAAAMEGEQINRSSRVHENFSQSLLGS